MPAQIPAQSRKAVQASRLTPKPQKFPMNTKQNRPQIDLDSLTRAILLNFAFALNRKQLAKVEKGYCPAPEHSRFYDSLILARLLPLTKEDGRFIRESLNCSFWQPAPKTSQLLAA